MTNTRFETFDPVTPPDPAASEKQQSQPKRKAWREVWNVFGCGHRFDVPMRFIPDENGTRIVQKTEEITER